MINYKERLTVDRELYPSKDIETTVESDRGRIFSSAINIKKLKKLIYFLSILDNLWLFKKAIWIVSL